MWGEMVLLIPDTVAVSLTICQNLALLIGFAREVTNTKFDFLPFRIKGRACSMYDSIASFATLAKGTKRSLSPLPITLRNPALKLQATIGSVTSSVTRNPVE